MVRVVGVSCAPGVFVFVWGVGGGVGGGALRAPLPQRPPPKRHAPSRASPTRP